jgi:predicted transcriptional regulator
VEEQYKRSKSSESTGFETYLESLQKGAKEQAHPSAGHTLVDLLQFLVEAGPVAVDGLPSRSGIPYTTVIKLIPKMLELDFAEVKGDPGEETIELTETGTSVAKIEL